MKHNMDYGAETNRKRLLGGLSHRLNNSIKMNPKETGLERTVWITLAQDRDM